MEGEKPEGPDLQSDAGRQRATVLLDAGRPILRSDGRAPRATGDLALATIARRQRSLVTDAQVLAAGLTRRAVRHRLAAARWRRMYQGVYLIGIIAPPLAGELAAVLTCGESAVLSGGPSASLLAILPQHPGPMEVTMAGRGCRRDGLVVRAVRHLDPLDITRHHGIPTTTAARTLLDLAAANHPQLDRAWNEALVLRRTHLQEVAALLERHAGRAGTAALRRLLDHERGPRMTRSEAERLLLELIRVAGLPPPRTNVRLGPYEIDFHWPEHRLVVEVDGFAFHRTRRAFERDRRRDADLAARGIQTIRLTWRQITEERARTVAVLAGALARRG